MGLLLGQSWTFPRSKRTVPGCCCLGPGTEDITSFTPDVRPQIPSGIRSHGDQKYSMFSVSFQQLHRSVAFQADSPHLGHWHRPWLADSTWPRKASSQGPMRRHILAGQENEGPDPIIPMGFASDIAPFLASISTSGLGVVEAQTVNVCPASWHSQRSLLHFHGWWLFPPIDSRITTYRLGRSDT